MIRDCFRTRTHVRTLVASTFPNMVTQFCSNLDSIHACGYDLVSTRFRFRLDCGFDSTSVATRFRFRRTQFRFQLGSGRRMVSTRHHHPRRQRASLSVPEREASDSVTGVALPGEDSWFALVLSCRDWFPEHLGAPHDDTYVAVAAPCF
jgi:hypothetical protein